MLRKALCVVALGALLGSLPAFAAGLGPSVGTSQIARPDVTCNVDPGDAISLTTLTLANVCSIAITETGDYDVWAEAGFTGGATTSITFVQANISTTSATLDDVNGHTLSAGGSISTAVVNYTGTVGPVVLSLTAGQHVYLVSRGQFTTDYLSAFGKLVARRIR